MAIPRFVNWITNKSYEKLAPNLGDMLLVTGALGWVLSSIAQATVVVFNKKISDDQKKFLIPQELADAGVNILSFIVLTRSCQKFGERLVEKGKLATPKIREFLEKNQLTSKIGTSIKEIVNDKEELKPFSVEKEILNPKNQIEKGLKKHYYNFCDGVIFISSTIGSIISCNIITPILRNKFASARQKEAIQREKTHKEPIFLPDSPVLPAYNKPGNDNRVKVASVNVPRIITGGSMRV